MTRRAGETMCVVLAVLAFVVGVGLPVWYWEGGLIEIEATTFIRQYLADRGPLEKLFDPRVNDWGMYQARELSYAFDYLDARVFDALWSGGGHMLFVPASAALAATLTIVIVLVAVRRYPLHLRLLSSLLLLAYVTGYVHLITMGVFYRSAKPMLLPSIAATVFYLLRVAWPVDGARAPRAAPLGVFALLGAMGLFDRLGFFYAGAATVGLAVHAMFMRGRRDLALAGVLAVVALVAYDGWLGPRLVYGFNGYWPDFGYQQIPFDEFLYDPAIPLRGALLMFERVGLLAGGLSPWIVGPLVVLIVMWGLRQHVFPTTLVPWGIALVVVQVTVGSLMYVRLPGIYIDYDNRLWYYPLPFQALFISLLIALAGRGVFVFTRTRTWVVGLVLVAAIAANVTGWDGHRQGQMSGQSWFTETYANNQALRASLAEGRLRGQMDPEYRELVTFMLARRPSTALRQLKDPD